MKRLIMFSAFLVLLAFAFVSCNKEELELAPVVEDQPQAMVHFFQPDLIISSYTTNISTNTNGCGPSLPNVGCGGNRSWAATITINNVGPANLPAGPLGLKWTDLTTGVSQNLWVNHGGISSGGSIQVSQNYNLGLCACTTPPNYSTHSFMAEVDPGNQIAESNENNNLSAQYDTCDSC